MDKKLSRWLFVFICLHFVVVVLRFFGFSGIDQLMSGCQRASGSTSIENI